MIIAGTRMYGKVDQVPGLFHLATEFFHIQFVPIGPTRSYLVLHGTNKGIRVGLSGKSVLFAYLRTALVLGGAVALCGGMTVFGEHLAGQKPQLAGALFAFAVGVVCLLLFFLSYRFSRASPLRAYRLAAQAGLSMEVLAEYYAERLTPEQLDEFARRVSSADEISTPSESHPNP